jgi:hypothetical protein
MSLSGSIGHLEPLFQQNPTEGRFARFNERMALRYLRVGSFSLGLESLTGYHRGICGMGETRFLT